MSQEKIRRVLICGPSGVGKTTVANQISKELGITYVNTSVRKLDSTIGDTTHFDMLTEYDSLSLLEQSYKFFSLRVKELRAQTGSYITDRGLVDVMAYEIIGNSHEAEACDQDTILELINSESTKLGITHIIFIPFTNKMFYSWKIEDDNKRITNPYFQTLVSKAYEIVFQKLGFKFSLFSRIFQQNPKGKLLSHDALWEVSDGVGIKCGVPSINFLILKETDADKRLKIIKKFLK